MGDLEDERISKVLAKFKDHKFQEGKSLGISCNGKNLCMYQLNYFEHKLQVLESFEEGEFLLAERVKFRRYYTQCSTAADPELYAFCTEVQDVSVQTKHASIAMVHGFAQCSDVFFEAAIHFALNGFFVYLIDLEGFGFTGGTRINRLTIEKFHIQVTALLEQVKPDLPCFLFGHSMGGLTVNNYLDCNLDITARLSGVIYSAPYFGAPDGSVDPGVKMASHVLKHAFEEFALSGPLPLHRVCKSKVYMRQQMLGRKAHPLLSLGLASSCFNAQDRLMANATKVNYPYLLVLGEKDLIVNNNSSRAWFTKTQSPQKQIKLMAGAFHELSKEPTNAVLFESCMKFMAERINGTKKTFGEFVGKRDYKAPKAAAAVWRRKKFWIIIYLLVGLLFALWHKQKKLIFTWPQILLLAKRFK